MTGWVSGPATGGGRLRPTPSTAIQPEYVGPMGGTQTAHAGVCACDPRLAVQESRTHAVEAGAAERAWMDETAICVRGGAPCCNVPQAQ